jgi:L-iditol 2-dehydrogenase
MVTKMKALIKKPNTKLVLENIDIPIASKNQSLIKVKSVGLCRTDLYVAQGQIVVDKPIIIGHEFCGEIIHTDSDVFKQGDIVSINPFQNGEFMGLNFDGALAEYVVVNNEYIVLAKENLKKEQIAYLEPVAASMAVLNANINIKMKGAIYGQNRIAQLTYDIMKSVGFDDLVLIDSENFNFDTYQKNSFDFIIETLIDDLAVSRIVELLKTHSYFILKSRQTKPVNFFINKLVLKDIKLEAVSYSNFELAMDWISKNTLTVDNLLGQSYFIDDYQLAFDAALSKESKKIFIHF